MHDAFVLSCTIHTMPTTPQASLAPSPTMTTITLPETNPQGYSSLPSTLVDVLRSMVDDPSISDVQFVFPRSKGAQLVTPWLGNLNPTAESRYSMSGMKNGKNSKYHHAPGLEDDIQSEEGGIANSEYSSMPNVRIISARKDILALRSEYFSKRRCGFAIHRPVTNSSKCLPATWPTAAPYPARLQTATFTPTR